LVFCLYRVFYKKGNYLAAFFCVYYWSSLYFCWGVFPRKVAFYYYYYPAAFMLGLAVTLVLPDFIPIPLSKGRVFRIPYFRWIAVGVAAFFFFYFLPILGAFQIGRTEFLKWMWFRSWI